MDFKNFTAPFYNVVNMLLMGIVFIGGLVFLIPDLMARFFVYVNHYHVDSKLVYTVFIAFSYMAGFLVSRVGSFIESCMRHKKDKNAKFYQIPWRDYNLYCTARDKEPFLNDLSREYGFARNSTALVLLLAILAGVNQDWCYLIGLVILFGLFYFATQKHARKIVKRVDKIVKK